MSLIKMEPTHYEIKEPYSKYGMLISRYIVDGGSYPFTVKGEFRIYINNKSCTAIYLNEKQKEYFKRLEDYFSRLAYINGLGKKDEFKIIKNSNKIYCRIYHMADSHPKCHYTELVDGKKVTGKLKDTPFDKFKGKCLIEILHAFFR